MIYYKWIHFHADLILWMTNCRFMTSLKACFIISLIKTFTCCIVSFCYLKNSHKKRKDSLQVVWIEYYLRLNLSGRGPENVSENFKTNVFFMWPASWSTDISSFYYSDINLFLIYYACCKLCNSWLQFSSLRTTPGVITT